jgi:hypothetical protein
MDIIATSVEWDGKVHEIEVKVLKYAEKLVIFVV